VQVKSRLLPRILFFFLGKHHPEKKSKILDLGKRLLEMDPASDFENIFLPVLQQSKEEGFFSFSFSILSSSPLL